MSGVREVARSSGHSTVRGRMSVAPSTSTGKNDADVIVVEPDLKSNEESSSDRQWHSLSRFIQQKKLAAQNIQKSGTGPSRPPLTDLRNPVPASNTSGSSAQTSAANGANPNNVTGSGGATSLPSGVSVISMPASQTSKKLPPIPIQLTQVLRSYSLLRKENQLLRNERNAMRSFIEDLKLQLLACKGENSKLTAKVASLAKANQQTNPNPPPGTSHQLPTISMKKLMEQVETVLMQLEIDPKTICDLSENETPSKSRSETAMNGHLGADNSEPLAQMLNLHSKISKEFADAQEIGKLMNNSLRDTKNAIDRSVALLEKEKLEKEKSLPTVETPSEDVPVSTTQVPTVPTNSEADQEAPENQEQEVDSVRALRESQRNAREPRRIGLRSQHQQQRRRTNRRKRSVRSCETDPLWFLH